MMRRQLRAGAVIAVLALTSLSACQKKPSPAPVSRLSATAVLTASAPSAAAPPPEAPAQSLFKGVSWSRTSRSLATWGGCKCASGSRFEGGEPVVCPVRIWDLPLGRLAATVETPCSHTIAHVGWSPSGDLFAISDFDSLRVWRLKDLARVFESEPLSSAGAFRWSPDGKLLLWGNSYGNAVLLRSESGEIVRRAEVLPPGAELDWDATWSDSGRFLAVTVENGPLNIWDGHTGAVLRELRVSGVSPLDAIHLVWRPGSEQLVFANDNGLLATANAGIGAVEVLSRPKGARRATRQTWITLRADGKLLAVNDGDGRLTLWDLASRRSRELLAQRASSWTSPVEFSRDLKYLALLRQGKLEIVSADSPGKVRRFDLGAEATPHSLVGWGTDGHYHAVVGKTLISFSPGGAESFRHEITEPSAGVTISPDGGFMAIAGQTLEILRLRDRRSIKLVLRQVAGRTEGAVEGAPDAAALAAFFDGHGP